jgi:hypothetical protein
MQSDEPERERDKPLSLAWVALLVGAAGLQLAFSRLYLLFMELFAYNTQMSITWSVTFFLFALWLVTSRMCCRGIEPAFLFLVLTFYQMSLDISLPRDSYDAAGMITVYAIATVVVLFVIYAAVRHTEVNWSNSTIYYSPSNSRLNR